MATISPEGEGGPSSVGAQTLIRGLDLIEQAVREPMRMVELVERSGLTRSTANRLITALVRRGFLAHGPGGRIRGGPELIRLGMIAQDRYDLVTVARPFLADLSAETGLSSFLGQRDGDYSVHLHRAQGRERVIVATPVGTRRKLVETSMGKALLFDEPADARRRLIAAAGETIDAADFDRRLTDDIARGAVIHEGPPPDRIRAVAAPVRNAAGVIVGAVSMATAAQYLETEQLEPMSGAIRDTARAISEALGWEA
ncbi:IclR family transcriptional regulator [Sphingomonas floccifaciens]|uniref:IclR family transcriptional regulator n=1 Tax=Sphingomonas floccifaciens TaxID=1844115 RepID=A0ABW4NB57_9SPHN